MLEIHICDDNKSHLEKVEHSLSCLAVTDNLDFQIQTHSAEKLLDYFRDKDFLTKPIILIMDIELDYYITGVEIATILKQRYQDDLQVVFLSNYPEYVFDAFESKPRYFLKKPIDSQELNKKILSLYNECINDKDILVVRNKQDKTKHILRQNNILSVELVSSATRTLSLHLNSRKELLVSGRLQYFEENLNSDFVRIYRSIIINMNFITSFSTEGVTMSNQLVFPIGQTRYAEFLSKYSQFIKK